MKQKVLVTREVFDETLAYLAQHVEVTSNQANVDYSRDQMVARLQGMDGAVVMTIDRVDEALLSRCPSFKAVCSASVGYNHIDLAACTRHGVMATNTPGVLTDSVADFAVCLTLATVRRAMEGEPCCARRVGGHAPEGDARGGSASCHRRYLRLRSHRADHRQRLRGFEVEASVYRLVRADPKVEQALGVTYSAKDDLLRQADIVILILPYTPETHYYIGAARAGADEALRGADQRRARQRRGRHCAVRR